MATSSSMGEARELKAKAKEKANTLLTNVFEAEVERAEHKQDVELTITNINTSHTFTYSIYNDSRAGILKCGFYAQQYFTDGVGINPPTIHTLFEGDSDFGIKIYFFNARHDINKRYVDFNDEKKNPGVTFLKNSLWSLLGTLDPRIDLTTKSRKEKKSLLDDMKKINKGKIVLSRPGPDIHIAIFPQSMLQAPGGFDNILTEEDGDILKIREEYTSRIKLRPIGEASASEGGFKKRRSNRKTKTRRTRTTKKTRRKTIKRKYSKKH